MVEDNLCTICIAHDMPLRVRWQEKTYCSLDQGLGVLDGVYRKPAPVDDDHNFLCTYEVDDGS